MLAANPYWDNPRIYLAPILDKIPCINSKSRMGYKCTANNKIKLFG